MITKTILAMAALGLMSAFSAQALDDSGGFKIIKPGDYVWVTGIEQRLYVNKADLLADEQVCGVYDGTTPQFQAMLKRFDDLQADDKAFKLHKREMAQIVQNEILHMHGETPHIAQIKIDGMVLWMDQSAIESDEESSQ
jgi:hypothetical protein